MKSKKWIALALACVMLLALAACGGDTTAASSGGSSGTAAASGSSGSSGSAGGSTTEEVTAAIANAGVKGANADPANTTVTDENLVIGLASEPSTLWGAASGKQENESQIINSALMDNLVNADKQTGDIIPELATSWEWVDGTHCRFTLRDDVTMSDGTPLVADDVVYTVGVWKEYSGNNDTGSYIVGAEAEDEHTVVIEFTTAAPDLLAMLTWSNFGIASEDEVNAAGGIDGVGRNPLIGSGKYRFKEWKNGQSITIERNDNYWDKDWKGYFKTITFTFTNDGAAREMAVESGDAGVAADMPVTQAATYAQNPNVSTIIYPFGQVMHLWYNMGDNAGATKDLKVRQAIDLALNFDAMSMVASGGFGQSALGYFPTDSKYYNATYTNEERAVQLDQAKALLAEAGYGDGLELSILGLQDTVPLYTVIQANLRDVGINLKIDAPDVPQFVMGANGGEYDMIVVGELADYRYPALLGFMRWANINTFWIGGPKWTTDEIESTIYAAIEEQDEAKAKEMLGTVEQLMKDNCVVSNICPEMHAAIIGPDLKGYTTIERGFMDPTNFYR